MGRTRKGTPSVIGPCFSTPPVQLSDLSPMNDVFPRRVLPSTVKSFALATATAHPNAPESWLFLTVPPSAN